MCVYALMSYEVMETWLSVCAVPASVCLCADMVGAVSACLLPPYFITSLFALAAETE